MFTTPKQCRSVTRLLAASIEAAQEELAKLPKEEPAKEIPEDFRGQVYYYLAQAIENAKAKASKLKVEDPLTHKYTHFESFPQALYDELQNKKHSHLKYSLENLGFRFYLTNEGNCNPRHPMVTFSLNF